MGRIVVTELISLDGVMQAPGDAGEFERGGWAVGAGDSAMAFKLDELMASDAQLLGRVTYEGFARAWPTMKGTGVFGERMNGMPKHVVSSTLHDPEWSNTSVLDGDLAADVADLRRRYDRDILVAGSARLVQGLFELGLVDRLHLMVFPVVLGQGTRLFGETSGQRPLRLVESRPVENGIVILIYEPDAR
jgi:dihydrofolate reductase